MSGVVVWKSLSRYSLLPLFDSFSFGYQQSPPNSRSRLPTGTRSSTQVPDTAALRGQQFFFRLPVRVPVPGTRIPLGTVDPHSSHLFWEMRPDADGACGPVDPPYPLSHGVSARIQCCMAAGIG